ncbi:hypothetical protein AB0P21_11440 [Kribbella sp. NPDC056861]|uniref:hypothetical protein n=1 Tax=Kribbella sp. NPDC056861 TaxID=3154857 RepID=UPI00343D478A
MSDHDDDLHLHARIFRAGCDWYADIGDHTDSTPEDPHWHGFYASQRAALDAACQQLLLRATSSA